MDFSVTLEDGELWLPSDIFPEDDNQINPSRPYDFNGNSMIDLSRRFSMLNFLAPQSTHHAGSAPSPNGYYAMKVGPSVDHPFLNPSQPGPALSLPIRPAFCPVIAPPVRPRVAEHQVMESSIAKKSTTVPLQQNGTVKNNFAFQAKANANGPRFNPSGMDCRRSVTGTGVFIPLAATSSRSPAAGRNLSGDGGQRISSNTSTLGKGHYHKISSSKVVLPKDWTY